MNIVETLTPVTTALTSAVTPADIVAIIGVVVGVGIGFALVWFGGRKIVNSFRKALTKGKISV